jgi:hypothetical protein
VAHIANIAQHSPSQNQLQRKRQAWAAKECNPIRGILHAQSETEADLDVSVGSPLMDLTDEHKHQCLAPTTLMKNLLHMHNLSFTSSGDGT